VRTSNLSLSIYKEAKNNRHKLDLRNLKKITTVMRNPSLLVLLLVVDLLSYAAARNQFAPGGWSPIDDINDPHVTEIANFAVTEYDRRSGAKLKFEKVIEGESQVVAGTNYRLTLSAADGSDSKNYEAVVWEKIWQHFRNLTSFVPVHA